MKVVTIGELKLGDGIPKIGVSLAEQTAQTVIEKAKLLAVSQADFIEWRLDYLEPTMAEPTLISLASELKQVLGEKPLLLTFRTLAEGGERTLGLDEYLNLYQVLLATGVAEAIDLEASLGTQNLEPLIAKSQQRGVKVILSKHDFTKTPSSQEMSQLLLEMEATSADLSKLAVMPKTAADVLALMRVTESLHQRPLGKPIITMSMGELGKVSRLSGKLTGSAVTFGAFAEASAPGQVELKQLRQIIDLL